MTIFIFISLSNHNLEAQGGSEAASGENLEAYTNGEDESGALYDDDI